MTFRWWAGPVIYIRMLTFRRRQSHRPLPVGLRTLDTREVLRLEARARSADLNQWLRPQAAWERVRGDGRHYVDPVSWHSIVWRKPFSRVHVRSMAMIEMEDGAMICSLLDIFPKQFAELAPLSLDEEKRVRLDVRSRAVPVMAWLGTQNWGSDDS